MLRHVFLAFAISTAAIGGSLSAAAPAQQTSDSEDALRLLATRMKAAESNIAAGQTVSAATVARLEEQMRRLDDDATWDVGSTRKRRAVMLELTRLKQLNAQPQRRAALPSAVKFDSEVITSSHGAECGNALGLSATLPVSFTMAARAKAGSSAWLRVVPAVSETLRISASSASADPALEIFPSCSATQALATSDDSIGLDASVALAARAGQPLVVHVTNSGSGDKVLVSVEGGNGSATGTVRDAATGTGIGNASVALFAMNGALLASAWSDPDGTYTIAQTPGNYYAISQVASYVTQIYSGVDCPPGLHDIIGCDPANATVVTISAGAATPGIDFSLDHGHSIRGQVRDSANHVLNNAVVFLYDGSGTIVQGYGTDQFGHYQIPALPPASYKVAAQADGFDAQMYEGIRCDGVNVSQCNIAAAAAVVVSSADILGIDFAMPTSAAISGRILLPNQQPASAQVFAVPISPTLQGASASTDQNGNYRLGPLQTGNYHVYALPSTGYFPRAYPNIDCAMSDCRDALANAGQIAIAQPGAQMTADIQLAAIPPITGRVTDAATGDPLGGVEIHFNESFGFYSFPILTVTDSNGNFSSNAVSTGNYYFWAKSADHVDQLYPGVDCETDFYWPTSFPCGNAGATTIAIAPGPPPPPLNFQLRRSSAIAGTVFLDAGPGSHIPMQANVGVYDATGKLQATAQTDATGNYAINDVPPGSYFALAGSNGAAVGQLWPGTNCAQPCTPSMGQPIPVASGATAGGIDFRLPRQDAIVGRVTDAGGNPVRGALIDLFQASDSSYLSSTEVDADGYYIASSAPGMYFVATEAGRAYVDQVHAGIACPLGAAYYGLCSLSSATAVSLNSTNLQATIINFVLQRPDPIFADGFE